MIGYHDVICLKRPVTKTLKTLGTAYSSFVFIIITQRNGEHSVSWLSCLSSLSTCYAQTDYTSSHHYEKLTGAKSLVSPEINHGDRHFLWTASRISCSTLFTSHIYSYQRDVTIYEVGSFGGFTQAVLHVFYRLTKIPAKGTIISFMRSPMQIIADRVQGYVLTRVCPSVCPHPGRGGLPRPGPVGPGPPQVPPIGPGWGGVPWWGGYPDEGGIPMRGYPTSGTSPIRPGQGSTWWGVPHLG